MKRGQYPKQRYQCLDSKHPPQRSRYFYGEDPMPVNVLLLDIETLPGWKRFWRMGEEDWNIDSVVKDWMILSYAAKWLFKPKIMSSIITPAEAASRNDERLTADLLSLMDQSHVVIAHNGDGFDLPKIKGRMLKYDMPPPSSFQTVDTLITSKAVFSLTSHKLSFLADYLEVGHKIKTDYDLWIGCEQGDKASLKDMLTYNEMDVSVLEDVYVKLRPWIKHPNMTLFIPKEKEIHRCPRCLGDVENEGNYRTGASIFTAFRCLNCGSLGRHHKRSGTSTVRSV
jgi:hypothetical protein